MSLTAAPLVSAYSIEIQASVDSVWDVLTSVEHVRAWDDVPEDFPALAIHEGAVLEWPGFARLEVTEFVPGKCLRYSYNHPGWSGPVGGIDYLYLIEPRDAGVLLTVRVGDWLAAPDGRGQAYHDASLEFVAEAAHKIRNIAEGLPE